MSSVSSGNSQDTNKKARKKRVRNWTKDDRAAHAIIEKSRREAFNEQLLVLAGLLPNLDGAKPTQLTKHVIVAESIEYIRAQTAAFDTSTEQAVAVARERDALLVEVNQWRSSCGMPARQASAQPGLQSTDNLPTIREDLPLNGGNLANDLPFGQALQAAHDVQALQTGISHSTTAQNHHLGQATMQADGLYAMQNMPIPAMTQSTEGTQMYAGTHADLYQPQHMQYIPFAMPPT